MIQFSRGANLVVKISPWVNVQNVRVAGGILNVNEKLTSIPTSCVFLWPLRLFHGNPSCTSALVRAPSWCLQTRTTKGSWPACYRLDMRMQRSERQRPFLHKVIFRGVGRSEEDSVIPGWVGWRMRWSVSCRTSTSLSLILFSDVRFLPPPSFAFFFWFLNLGVYGKDKSLSGGKYKKSLTNRMPK